MYKVSMVPFRVRRMHMRTHYRTNARPPVTSHLEARDGKPVSYGAEAARSIPSLTVESPRATELHRRTVAVPLALISPFRIPASLPRACCPGRSLRGRCASC